MSAACGGETVTLRALLPDLGARDHALVSLLVALCFMHPVPMPGLSWALAALAAFAGTRMARGRALRLPRRLADRPMPARFPGKLLGLAARLFARTESLIKPRAAWLTGASWAPAATGAAIAACGAMLLVPLPPPTNFPPAIALLLLSLGVLESDGLFLVLGYLAALGSAVIFGCLLTLGWAGMRTLVARL
jgi:hypothetical protein